MKKFLKNKYNNKLMNKNSNIKESKNHLKLNKNLNQVTIYKRKIKN